MRNLFEMSDAELDASVEAYNNRLYEKFYEYIEPECSNCQFYYDGMCDKLLNALTDDELDEMQERDDYSKVEMYSDDYCDRHELKECD